MPAAKNNPELRFEHPSALMLPVAELDVPFTKNFVIADDLRQPRP